MIGLLLARGQTVRRITSVMSQCHAGAVVASAQLLLHIYIFTRSHLRSTSLPPHTHTSAHLYHTCTSTQSLLHIRPLFLSFFLSTYLSFFLSTYLFSHLCTFTSSHAHICRSTSSPPHICASISHLHIHTVTPSHPPSLSLFLHICSLNIFSLNSSQLLTQ